MTRAFAVSSTLFLALCALAQPAAAIGKSSASECIAISSCEELQSISLDLDGDYCLTQDVDCSASKSWNNGSGFAMLGRSEYEPFTGKLDGQGYSITGLYLRVTGGPVGLFHTLGSNATVQNLTLKDVEIRGTTSVGALATRALSATVSSVGVSGQITTVGGAGGLIGETFFGTQIEHCWSTATITTHYVSKSSHGPPNEYTIADSHAGRSGIQIPHTGSYPTYYAGGLVGLALGDGTIWRSWSKATVRSPGLAGGLVGAITDGRISQSWSKAQVVNNTNIADIHTYHPTSLGSLVGMSIPSRTGARVSVTDCWTGGEVAKGHGITLPGLFFIGGLVGSIADQHVQAPDGTHIERTLSFTKVSGEGESEGLIGEGGVCNYFGCAPRVSQSYWDVEASTQAHGSAGIGLETEYLVLPINGRLKKKPDQDLAYTGWNFRHVWEFIGPGHYPSLRWQKTPHPAAYDVAFLVAGQCTKTEARRDVLIKSPDDAGTAEVEKVESYLADLGLSVLRIQAPADELFPAWTNLANYPLVLYTKCGFQWEPWNRGDVQVLNTAVDGGAALFMFGDDMAFNMQSVQDDDHSIADVQRLVMFELARTNGTEAQNSKVLFTKENLHPAHSGPYGFGTPDNYLYKWDMDQARSETFLFPRTAVLARHEAFSTPVFVVSDENETQRRQATLLTNIYNDIKGSPGDEARHNAEVVFKNTVSWLLKTESECISINSCEELQNIAQNPSGNYCLEQDLDCSMSSDWNNGDGFSSLGWFSGSLDGKGHRIFGLHMHSTSTAGLFDRLQPKSVVKNLTLEDVNIQGYTSAGALAASAVGATISGVGVTGQIVSPGREAETDHGTAGGILGRAFTGTVVSDCWSEATVVSDGDDINHHAGGLVGAAWATDVVDLMPPLIQRSWSKATVNARGRAGGLVSWLTSGKLEQSWAAANVTGHIVGGLVGVHDQGTDAAASASISDCWAGGLVHGDIYSGGLVGAVRNGSTIRHALSFAQLTSEGGGLVGTLSEENRVTHSYWDVEASGRSDSSAGTGLSTQQLQHKETYASQNFNRVWELLGQGNYPTLRWQGGDGGLLPRCFGDLNGDYQVDQWDGLLFQACADCSGPNCERRCDYNYDGVVNNIDALHLLDNVGKSCEIPRSGI